MVFIVEYRLLNQIGQISHLDIQATSMVIGTMTDSDHENGIDLRQLQCHHLAQMMAWVGPTLVLISKLNMKMVGTPNPRIETKTLKKGSTQSKTLKTPKEAQVIRTRQRLQEWRLGQVRMRQQLSTQNLNRITMTMHLIKDIS